MKTATIVVPLKWFYKVKIDQPALFSRLEISTHTSNVKFYSKRYSYAQVSARGIFPNRCRFIPTRISVPFIRCLNKKFRHFSIYYFECTRQTLRRSARNFTAERADRITKTK